MKLAVVFPQILVEATVPLSSIKQPENPTQAPMLRTPHNVTAEDARGWFGKLAEKTIAASEFELFAGSINRCRWPDDPEPMRLPLCQLDEDDEEPTSIEWPWNATEATDLADGAKRLLERLPIIAEHWHQQARFLSKDPRETLLRLQDVLRACLPLIEYPLGEVESAVGIPKASKQWQMYALLIARRAIWVLNKAGYNQPSLDRNSIVARVVHETMKRMQIRDIQTVTTSGVSAFLTRWRDCYGLVAESPIK